MAQVKAELGRLRPDILQEYKVDLNNLQFFEPKKGVENGYKGRLGIYEIFPMTKDIEKLILSGKVSEYDMIEIAQRNGMITMAQDGLLKALDGLTSVEEVLRVAELTALEEAPDEPEVPSSSPAPSEPAE
jgi:type IV pilus assembly protein PilB